MKINFTRPLCFFLALVLLTAFTVQKRKTKVYLIGDSTMSVKPVKGYPEAGWGMPFAWFFDETVDVDNRAANGRSTKSFFNEKRWDSVLDSLQAGDYVFIQFGHNDEVPTKKAYATEEEFVKYLTMYVEDTKAAKAIPVLITPVARRKFSADGQVEDTHKVYAQLVRNTAWPQSLTIVSFVSFAFVFFLFFSFSNFNFSFLKQMFF